jgi:type II secretory pathway component PulK
MKMSPNKKKGLVIIAVLWTAVLLTVMAAVLGRKSRLDMKVCMARMEAVRCKWAARAGIEKAIAVLKEDATENQTDGLLDLWSNNDEDFNNVPLNRCRFSVQVIDEASKLNINTATKEQLLGLPDMVEEIADAIIDWRDTDDTPSGAGVESGYYESLPYGYMARNGPFKTIRELLLVKDVTEELLYGEDTNLNGRLDYNENDGDLSPPSDDADGMLDVGWAAYLTCYPSSSSQSTSTSGQTTGGTSGQTSGSNQSGNSSGQTSGGSNQSSGGSGQSSGGSNPTSGSSGQTSGGSGRTSSGSSQTSGGSSQNSGGSSQTSSGSNQTSGGSNQTSTSSEQTTSTSTTQTSVKVNVNTASDIVLAALLGGGDDAERTAQSIISYRETLTDGIQNISELSQAGGISSDVLSQIQNYLTTSSNIFTIRCTATADRNGLDGTTLYTEAVVDRSSTPCKILFWYQEGSN